MEDRSGQQAREVVRRLRSVAGGLNPRGQAFEPHEVADAVALVFLAYPAEARREPPAPEIAALLGDWAQRAGLDAESAGDALQSRVEEYFRRRPVEPMLLTSLLEILRDMLAAGALDRGTAFARFMDDDLGRQRLLERGAPPEGSVAAGPLAAQQLRGVLKKKQPQE